MIRNREEQIPWGNATQRHGSNMHADLDVDLIESTGINLVDSMGIDPPLSPLLIMSPLCWPSSTNRALPRLQWVDNAMSSVSINNDDMHNTTYTAAAASTTTMEAPAIVCNIRNTPEKCDKYQANKEGNTPVYITASKRQDNVVRQLLAARQVVIIIKLINGERHLFILRWKRCYQMDATNQNRMLTVKHHWSLFFFLDTHQSDKVFQWNYG